MLDVHITLTIAVLLCVVLASFIVGIVAGIRLTQGGYHR